jgi:hypothetical protein
MGRSTVFLSNKALHSLHSLSDFVRGVQTRSRTRPGMLNAMRERGGGAGRQFMLLGALCAGARGLPPCTASLRGCIGGSSGCHESSNNLTIMSALFKCLLFALLQNTLASFTIPVSWLNNNIQMDSHGTWCYYPTSGSRAISCGGDFTPQFNAHLNQTTSIGYYDADGTLLGGPQWPFQASIGKVTLCVSGRAGDSTYQTMCSPVYADNSPGSGGYCQMTIGQSVVTDGCYVAEIPPSSSSPSTTTPASSAPVPPPTATSTGTSSGVQKSMIESILGLLTAIIAVVTAVLGVKCWKKRRNRRQGSGSSDNHGEFCG